MSRLKLLRHEEFVQKYLENGQHGQEAYLAVYRTRNKITARTGACHLLNLPHVKRRIAEIQKRGAIRTEVTLERLIREADDIQRKALKAKSYASAVSALIAKAKLAGFWIERTHGESFNVNYVIGDHAPSEEDWRRQHVTAF